MGINRKTSLKLETMTVVNYVDSIYCSYAVSDTFGRLINNTNSGESIEIISAPKKPQYLIKTPFLFYLGRCRGMGPTN